MCIFHRPQLQLLDKRGGILIEKVFTIMMMVGGNWTNLLLYLNRLVIFSWLLLMAGFTSYKAQTPVVILDCSIGMILRRTSGYPYNRWEKLQIIATWYIWMASYMPFMAMLVDGHQETWSGMIYHITDGRRYNDFHLPLDCFRLWLIRVKSLQVFLFGKNIIFLILNFKIILSCWSIIPAKVCGKGQMSWKKGTVPVILTISSQNHYYSSIRNSVTELWQREILMVVSEISGLSVSVFLIYKLTMMVKSSVQSKMKSNRILSQMERILFVFAMKYLCMTMKLDLFTKLEQRKQDLTFAQKNGNWLAILLCLHMISERYFKNWLCFRGWFDLVS